MTHKINLREELLDLRDRPLPSDPKDKDVEPYVTVGTCLTQALLGLQEDKAERDPASLQKLEIYNILMRIKRAREKNRSGTIMFSSDETVLLKKAVILNIVPLVAGRLLTLLEPSLKDKVKTDEQDKDPGPMDEPAPAPPPPPPAE